ncbi:hypothetical protein ACF1CY_002578 [Providencia rettgeri]
MNNLKATMRRMLDGDDMDCVSDRTGKSGDYCEGFVDGMHEALNQLTEGVAPLLTGAEIVGLERFVARMYQRANQLVDDSMSTALINQTRSAAVLAEQMISELKGEGQKQ